MGGQKNLALEGLRGIASLTVAIGHFMFVIFPHLETAFRPVPGSAPASRFEEWAASVPFTLLYSAEAAVCVFLVMSGYVLTTKYFATGEVVEVQAAAAKRYVRLALPTGASILFAWALWRSGAIDTGGAMQIGGIAGWLPSWYEQPYSFLGAIWNGLIGSPLLGDAKLNPPSWTIQVEMIGSILLFSMIALFGRRPILLLFWSLFLINILGFRAPNTLFYVAFFAGAFLNPARDWLRSNQVVSILLVCVGLVGVAYNALPAFDAMRLITLPNLQRLGGPDFGLNPRLFWNTLGAIALVAGVIGSRDVDRALSARPFVFLGRISFSMYLIHAPILVSLGLWTFRQWKGAGLSHASAGLLTFPIFISVVIAGSVIFYRLVDAPSTRLASYLARKTSIRPQALAAISPVPSPASDAP